MSRSTLRIAVIAVVAVAAARWIAGTVPGLSKVRGVL